MTRHQTLSDLLDLSHELGDPTRGLAILGEGNTSAQLSAKSFLVKASGTCLATLKKDEVVECSFSRLLPLLDQSGLKDAAVDAALLDSRVDAAAKKPSVEALFHGYLLSLPDVNYVGHTHATAVNSILCSPRAREFATGRMFPDEIVCCDVESVFVAYTDPGLKLSVAIRRGVEEFIQRLGRPPKVILMENHGLIALGKTPNAVLSATFMAEKAATVFLGAAALGGPRFLTAEHIARIAGRPDEKYRQKVLKV
jgi:rhamnose utilization protein RhaD (predicted bifunctional aldolase and dehydrogenase)